MASQSTIALLTLTPGSWPITCVCCVGAKIYVMYIHVCTVYMASKQCQICSHKPIFGTVQVVSFITFLRLFVPQCTSDTVMAWTCVSYLQYRSSTNGDHALAKYSKWVQLQIDVLEVGSPLLVSCLDYQYMISAI